MQAPAHTDIEAAGDGWVAFNFKLEDRAGNVSILSTHIPLPVLLKDAPADVLAPLVPAFDDGLVTEADARVPVVVEIPQYTNAAAGDEITVIWGTRRAAPAKLSPEDTGNDPMIGVELAYSLLAEKGYGAVGVKYEIVRGSILGETSPARPVLVDMTTPSVDPKPETPEDENLPPAAILGNSGTPNTITPDDYELDATVTIPWNDLTGAPYMLANDIVQVFWGAQRLASYTVKSTDAVDLLLPVLNATIQAEGSGDVPVHYTVSRALSTTPHIGTSQSPMQPVNVLSAADLPGGPGGLKEGNFIEKNVDNAINRDVIADGSTPLRITNYVNLKLDDHIELFLIGIDNYAGDGNEIEASRFEPTHDVVEADRTRGYIDFLIPELNILHICTTGSIKAKYKVTAKDTGANATSAEALVLVDVKLPSEPTCPIPLRR